MFFFNSDENLRIHLPGPFLDRWIYCGEDESSYGKLLHSVACGELIGDESVLGV